MEKFNLLHTALYAKHWYKRFSDENSKNKTIFEDLKKCLTLDGYSGVIMDDHDVYIVILNNCQRIDKPCFKDFGQLLNGVCESECWKHGYHHNLHTWIKDFEQLPKYDLKTAVIYYCLSNIACLGKDELGVEKLPKPDYKNCLPKPKQITQKQINEMFKD